MHGADERWIQWWCAPWQWAHPGWVEPFVEGLGVPVQDVEPLLRGRHSAFLHSVGITPSQPPAPIKAWVQWLMLNTEQQDRALNLAASICLGRAEHSEETDPHENWCRAVAKALRPGAWLDPSLNDPRLLLAAWAGQDCWSRLRLSWAPDTLPPSFMPLPANKLQTLWQSVLWRVATV